MQYRFFTIPITNPADSAKELNTFLGSRRVLVVQREFVNNGENSFWALAVEYLTGAKESRSSNSAKKRIDYREILSTEDFALFSKLREWRKTTAEKEAVPVYTVFTNEQLAKIACNRTNTVDALRQIEGVGEARIRKYSKIIELLRQLTEHET